MTCEKLFAENFYGIFITYFATLFQDSIKLFWDKSPGKSNFVIKSLITPLLRE